MYYVLSHAINREPVALLLASLTRVLARSLLALMTRVAVSPSQSVHEARSL